MSDDDVFHNDQCTTGLWDGSIFFQEKGSFLLGLGRLVSFFCIMGLHRYNRRLLREKEQDNVNVIPGLVLPYYFSFIYLYISLSLLAAIVDLSLSPVGQLDNEKIYNWLVPAEQAVFHWFYEGLSFFLMRYGAGIRAIKRSLYMSGVWSLITFVFYFFMYSSLKGSFVSFDPDRAYILVTTYFSCMWVFYGMFIVVPKRWVFRRSALNFYSYFNFAYYTASLIFSSVAYYSYSSVICPASIVSFIYIAFVQPLVLFRTLQIDSQFWQGLKPGKAHPLAEVWDHVDVETAQSMAEQAEKVDGYSSTNALPVLHYGLLDFDKSNAYVAGGFSRVYFGSLKGERVAFKILFAMELTPRDVKDFYQEASLLHSLRHENVVACRGICVMPPALTMVLELCKYGSLFDFLYKPTCEQTVMVENTESVNALHDQEGGGGGGAGGGALAVVPEGVLAPPSRFAPLSISSVDLRSKSPVQDNTTMTQRLSATFFRTSHSSRASSTSSRSRSSARLSSVVSEGGEGGSFGEKTSRATLSAVRRTYDTVANYLGISFSGAPASAGGSSLQTIIVSAAHSTTMDLRLQMMRDCACAIAFLHSRGVMHCDIKSLNFLVDQNFRVKLADLGEARSVLGPPKHKLPPIPSRTWAPPEVLPKDAKAESYTIKSEIYGLAVVLCELLTITLPFGDAPDRMTQVEWHTRLVEDNLRPELPLSVPIQLRQIIEQALRTDPVYRPSAQEIHTVLDNLIVNRGGSASNSVDNSREEGKAPLSDVRSSSEART